MDSLRFIRRLTKGAYRATRIFVHFLGVLVILGVVAFVFLRIYGVPEPLLREILRHVNAAGIPVEVDGITLTLRGWRADGVRYYSANPDDLKPIYTAEQVSFSVRNSRPEGAGPEGWNVDVKAVGVAIDPSVEWGMEIPEESPSRRVGQVEATLGFRPDRIVLSNGKMDWLGSRFEVAGTVFKKETKPGAAAPARKQKTLLPVFITRQRFQTLESRLAMLSLPNGATIKIGFEVDTANYSASWVDLAIDAEEVGFRGLGFSKLEIVGSYTYPKIHLEHAALFQGKHSVRLVGDYNLDSREVAGSLYNSITSNQP